MLRAEEPARRLGGVARVAVVGEQADERPLELLVQSGEQKRQDRLGDAGTARQRAGELLEALVGANLVDEGVQYRTVHDERRDTRPAESSLGALAGPARMRGSSPAPPAAGRLGRQCAGVGSAAEWARAGPFGGVVSSRPTVVRGSGQQLAATHLGQTQRQTNSTSNKVNAHAPP